MRTSLPYSYGMFVKGRIPYTHFAVRQKESLSCKVVLEILSDGNELPLKSMASRDIEEDVEVF